MKVTLVSLRSGFLDNDKIYPPLANLYLHQRIKQTLPDVSVKVTDNPTLEELIDSDFVGVSVMTPQRDKSLELLNKLKGKTKLIIGGPHVKHYLNEVKEQGWDYVVPLDGLRPITSILNGANEGIHSDFITASDYASNWVKPARLDNAQFLREFNYSLEGKVATTMLTAQGCPMCLRGNTLINTVKGKIPIKDLINKKIGVLTWDSETDQVIATEGINIRKTRRNAELLRIHLSNGTHIDCTPDHRFLTIKNGNQFTELKHIEKEAQFLKKGEWLKGISFETNQCGHVSISWGRRKKRLEHRIIAEYKIKRKLNKNEIVHHKDKNPSNNHIDNLEILKNQIEHLKFHEEISERMKLNNPSSKYFIKKSIIKRKRKINGGKRKFQVIKIEKLKEREDTYDLEVPFNNWFFANDVLIHNSCAFCEDARTTARWTPLSLIQEELDDIIELGYKGIYLFDDLFAIAMPKVKPICEEIRKRGLIYRCNGQANFFTKWGEDFAKMLADSGCVEMAFGHESGSQTILDNVIKRTKVEQNYKSVEYAKKYGIKVKSFLMLGLPGETYETIKATEEFIKNSGIDDFQLAVYMPYKGTQIRDAIDKGENIDLQLIPKGQDGEITGAYGIRGGNTSYEVRTSALSAEELESERERLVNKYKPQSHMVGRTDNFFDSHLNK